LPARVEARIRGLDTAVIVAPSLRAGLAWAAACGVGFLAIPLALTGLVNRRGPASIGYSLRGFLRHVWVYLGLYLLMVPVVWIASTRPDFQLMYPFVRTARTDLGHFIRWESAYLMQFVALEAFFRGYLLFTLERRMGWNAIFVMIVPYGMIHFHKPPLEAFGALLAGILLGALALRFRSFWGGALLHGLVALTMDSISAYQSGLFR
jgi:membrane protease YdiL (CAAX protease family)